MIQVVADAVPIEELLHHADWLRRLAASLAGDGADDLLQETWAAALSRPPRGGQPVRPWLARVLKNFWLMRRRGLAVRERNRDDVATRAGPSAPPRADELLARLEVQRTLARLVAELDEPFRETILLRYTEGMSAAAIARAQKLPAGTVRWRLKTGLDRIRAALDGEAGGARERWLRALVPLYWFARPPRPSPWPVATVLAAFAALWLGLWASFASPAPESVSGIPDPAGVADAAADDAAPAAPEPGVS